MLNCKTLIIFILKLGKKYIYSHHSDSILCPKYQPVKSKKGIKVKSIQTGKHEMKIALIHRYHDCLCKKFQGILKNNPRTNN